MRSLKLVFLGDAVYRWPVVESEIPVSIQKKNVVMVGDTAHKCCRI